jgi:putative transposase
MSSKIGAKNPKCRYCGSSHVRKYGLYKGVQNYFCNDCGSKFKNDDVMFKMKLDANMVSTAVFSYYEGTSIEGIRRLLLQEHQHAPSSATVYEWIQKYTQYITDSIKDYHPKVGDVWIGDETILKIGGQHLWLFDLIDDKTRMLLSTRLSRSRTTEDAQMLIDRAVKLAGKHPKVVVTDKLASYLDVFYGKDAEHRQGGIARAGDDNTQKIERFHGTLKNRTKVMRGLKNFETAHDFTQGWLAYYNYLRPHESLQGKTPAEVAGIQYPYKNWADIIRKHKPSTKIIIEHQPRAFLKLQDTYLGKRKRKRRVPKSKTATKTTTMIASMRLTKGGK